MTSSIIVAVVQCEALWNWVKCKNGSFQCASTLVLLLRGAHAQPKWIFNPADVASRRCALAGGYLASLKPQENLKRLN